MKNNSTTGNGNKCLFPPCPNKPWVRGLCHVHYAYMGKMKKKLNMTWEQLEKTGRCLPAKRTGKSSGFRDWMTGKNPFKRGDSK